MIRNVFVLALNDLAIAYTNKTLILILFIPLFVFVSLKLVDQNDTALQPSRVGLLQEIQYSPDMVAAIKSAHPIIEVTWLASNDAGIALLGEKKLDGVLVPSTDAPDRLELLVLTTASIQTLTLIERIAAIQDTLERKNNKWIANVRALHDSGIQKQTLPTWMLMLVLLVGLIVMPVQVAEEKEKNLLLGLLQTPILEVEWLLAKVILGIVLTGIAVGFLQVLGRFDFSIGATIAFITFIIIGGFCFSATGVLLGFLCRSQATARTLGVLCYLPNLLPAALSDFSQKLALVAPLLPSFHFYEPVRAILLEDGRLVDYSGDLIYLGAVGIIMIFLSWLLIKKRWLM